MITASITLIAQAAPLLIAACAALVSEYAGLLNVGIEGLMLLSAFTGIGGILLTESLGGLIPGLAVSLTLGAGLSMFITYLAIYRKANIYILGLAVNLTAAGFVSILSTRFFGNRSIVALPPELLLLGPDLGAAGAERGAMRAPPFAASACEKTALPISAGAQMGAVHAVSEPIIAAASIFLRFILGSPFILVFDVSVCARDSGVS